MNAVIYTRVSTSEQVENYSLDMQEKACIGYCRNNGINVDRIFREEGKSAKTLARPILRELLEYCSRNAKRIDFVIVYRVDRLARMVYDHQMIRMTLQRLDILLRAVQESFDESAAGHLLENVMAAIAQFDNDVRAARTADGMREGLKQGRWMWLAPIGYLNSPRSSPGPSLLHDPETAPLIRLAFELLGGGKTKSEALEDVTALGLARRGKPLSPQSFNDLLRNPIYKGRVVSAGLEFDGPGDFEPLVSTQLFDKVQDLGRQSRDTPNKRTWDHPDFPLRRFMRCGKCNTPLTGSWSTGRSARYGYYRCPKKGCGGVSIRKERLESGFIEELGLLSARRNVFKLLNAIVRDAWHRHQEDSEAKNARLQAKIVKLENRKNELLKAYLYDKKIDDSTYTREKERLDVQIEAAASGFEEPPFTNEDLDQALIYAERLLDDLPSYWNRLEPKWRPRFLKAVFPTGLVYNDGRIGTAESPCFYLDSSLLQTGEEGLVAPTGFEPALLP